MSKINKFLKNIEIIKKIKYFTIGYFIYNNCLYFLL